MHGRTRVHRSHGSAHAWALAPAGAALMCLLLRPGASLAGAPPQHGDSAFAAPDPPGALAPPVASPLGGLLVGPTRVVFEGSRRSADLTLVNTGFKTASYRIGFVRLKMTEKGEIRQVADTDSIGAGYSDTLVRYAPRRVTLEPHVPQTVRLQLRKPEGLPAGEYRSHLLFQAIPDPVRAGEAQAASVAAPGVQLQLIPVFGVSIPVIVRCGETAADVALDSLRLEPAGQSESGPRLHLQIARAGSRSVYGDLTVTLSRDGYPDETVAAMKGVAVYTPLPRRLVDLPLHLPPGLEPAKCRLRVQYGGKGNSDGLLAEAQLQLR